MRDDTYLGFDTNDWHQPYILYHRQRVLRMLLEARVVDLVRLNWPPFPEHPGVEHSQASIFSEDEGELWIKLESGYVLGFRSERELRSISVWIEESPDGRRRQRANLRQMELEDKLWTDGEIAFVSAADPVYSTPYWASLINQRIIKVIILVERDYAEYYQPGLLLEFEDGKQLVLSQHLHKGPSEFAVVTPDRIQEALQTRLVQIPVS